MKLSEGGEKQGLVGLKTNTAHHGRSFPLFWASCFNDPDPEKSRRVMEVMLKMDKIDIKN
jgi:hypothetical protein